MRPSPPFVRPTARSSAIRASSRTPGYSFVVGLITIVVSLAIIVPTAYWVRLRLPRLRPVVEFVTLMPFVIPPVVLVFGLIRIYSRPPLLLTGTRARQRLRCSCAAYVVLSFPYMYRAVDTGLAAIDVRTPDRGGAEPRRRLDPDPRAGHLPEPADVAILSGAFLTLAIVIGEYTIALVPRSAVRSRPYLSLLGETSPYQPAAVSLISFGLTWLAMVLIAVARPRTRAEAASPSPAHR